jgi:DNA-binding NarL/FixJ family response regulator
VTVNSIDTPIPIVLVMENSLYRQGIAMLLESSGDVRVVDQAENVATWKPRFDNGERPVVVVLDGKTAPDGGIELSEVHECRKMSPESCIAVISDIEAPERIIEVFEAGAHAYVLRETQAGTLIDAVRALARSEYVVDSRVTGALLSNLREMRRRLEVYGASDTAVPLTTRQRELLELVAGGYTNRQIAQTLDISESTVKNHLHTVFGRLGVASRSQAISVAVRLGILRP